MERSIDVLQHEVKLSDIGVEHEEMSKYMEALRTGVGNPARHICICGHGVTRHHINDSTSYCKIAKSWCYCTEVLPVLEPEDLRPFTYTTSGVGKEHALAKGLFALSKLDKSARWLIKIACFKCLKEQCRLTLVSLSRELRIKKGPGFSNALLCDVCFLECGGYR